MLVYMSFALFKVKLKSADTKLFGLTVRAVEWQPIQLDERCTNNSIVVFVRIDGCAENTVEGVVCVGGVGHCVLISS